VLPPTVSAGAGGGASVDYTALSVKLLKKLLREAGRARQTFGSLQPIGGSD
jgi:hypothetical protein